MIEFDLKAEGVRSVNSRLHGLPKNTNERHWLLKNPQGQHAIACGLETTSQNPVVPSFVDSQTSAAIGRATMSVRYAVTKPRERAVDARSLGLRAAGATATASTALASCPTHLPLDPGHHPVVRVEEPLLHLRPAAEPELVDREEPRPGWEPGLELRGDHLVHRAVAVLREDALRGGRP